MPTAAMTFGHDDKRMGTRQAESVRLGAARSLLDLGVKLREAVEIECRLAELEERIEK